MEFIKKLRPYIKIIFVILLLFSSYFLVLHFVFLFICVPAFGGPLYLVYLFLDDIIILIGLFNITICVIHLWNLFLNKIIYKYI